IKGVLKEEYERLNRLMRMYQKEIKKYSKGSISIKRRRSLCYAYLAYWNEGRANFKYLGPPSSDKVKKIAKQIKERRRYESLLKETKLYFKEVSKVIHGRRI
ncbi:hypothetical protein KKH42_00125, partial [bacterium]|nr:hypothetical protein [bacterium]